MSEFIEFDRIERKESTRKTAKRIAVVWLDYST